MKIERCTLEQSLKRENIYAYGGYSIVYRNPSDNKCLKIYRNNISTARRELIKDNYIDLNRTKSLESNSQFLTPTKLLLDSDSILQSIELPFLPYPNMWWKKREAFMTKKYLNVILDMIKVVKKLTNKGIIITDLKLSNMLVSPEGRVIITDNDFSINVANTEMLNEVALFAKNIYAKNYFSKFKPTFDEDYNRYMLINMMTLLLIENEQLDEIWPKCSSPSMDTLIEINRIIQMDRALPRSLKQNIKNILTATTSLDISQNMIDDYHEAILRKIKVRETRNW